MLPENSNELTYRLCMMV